MMLIKTKIIVYDTKEYELNKKMGIDSEPTEHERDFWFELDEVVAFRPDLDKSGEQSAEWSIVYLKNGENFVVNVGVTQLERLKNDRHN